MFILLYVEFNDLKFDQDSKLLILNDMNSFINVWRMFSSNLLMESEVNDFLLKLWTKDS